MGIIGITPKREHVFLAPFSADDADDLPYNRKKVVIPEKDRERAKQQQVSVRGWIDVGQAVESATTIARTSACNQTADNNAITVSSPVSAFGDGKVVAAISSTGYDFKGVGEQLTGFISEHEADIAVGYATTMLKKYYGSTFVFVVDQDAYERMIQDLPAFEDSMIRAHEAQTRERSPVQTEDFDCTIIVKKNEPGVFHKALEIVAKRNINIKSIMGGPYFASERAQTPNKNRGCIRLQIEIPVEGADETARNIQEELETRDGWFASVVRHGKTGAATKNPGNSIADPPGARAAKPTVSRNRAEKSDVDQKTVKANKRTEEWPTYFMEEEHFGP